MNFKSACVPLLYILLLITSNISYAQISEPGTAATISAIISATEPEPSEIKEETVDRELDAGEDPLESKITELQDKPFYKYQDHTSADIYGSVRLRYTANDHEDDLDDGGSRAGINGEFQFRPQFWVLGRAEVGFNVFDTVNQLLGSSDRLKDDDAKVSPRLGYAGLQTPSTTLTYGKNWSSYYQVSGLTDRFTAFGGEASGTFNALTDGGASGTGRADNVFQGRLSINRLPESWRLKPFKLHVQYQPGEDIPQTSGTRYQHSLGFSAILESQSEKVIGLAYNQALVDEEDLPALKQYGIKGDARAFIIGTRRFSDKYYAATSISRLENHETTDTGQYFNGWGWEFFGSYNFIPRWWVIGGWNLLEPDSKQPLAGDYRLRYGVVGLRYTFDEFRKMIYTETRIDDSMGADGSRSGNTYTVGLRWDLR